MVHAGVLPAPDAAIAVMLVVGVAGFEVVRVVERRADKVPAQRGAVALVHRKRLVGAPTHRAVVDNQLVVAVAAKGIVAARTILEALVLVLIAQPEAHELHNQVVGVHRHREVGQADATAGGRLTRNGGLGLLRVSGESR